MAKSECFIPLDFRAQDEESMQHESRTFYQLMSQRRTVREFSDQGIPQEVLENALMAAGTAPSGANMQPWHFVVVKDAAVKKRIREAAEIEEQELYEHRASDEWLQALAPLGTDANKPFLEKAPALIAIFLKKFTVDKFGEKHKNYYTTESVWPTWPKTYATNVRSPSGFSQHPADELPGVFAAESERTACERNPVGDDRFEGVQRGPVVLMEEPDVDFVSPQHRLLAGRLPVAGVVPFIFELPYSRLEELEVVVMVVGDTGAEDVDEREALVLDRFLDELREVLDVGAEAPSDISRAVHDRGRKGIDGKLEVSEGRALGLHVGAAGGRDLARGQAVDLVVHHQVGEVDVAARGMHQVVSADAVAVPVAAGRDHGELVVPQLGARRYRERAPVQGVHTVRIDVAGQVG